MIGPSPIDTVGNSQKFGISQGCGYDDSPGLACNSRRKFFRWSSESRPKRNARA